MAEQRFHKGDLVRFRLTTRSVQGVIREDRGPIGIRGRHLYLVEFSAEPQAESVSEIELPADELESLQHLVSTA